ncbi:hypothetical protein ACFY93_02990 [Streptomyces sp. NPDC008313]|uniref:hypothetical protein n=1 Tax=Streptomyces sp. NPDC008313 TaxID=3364826 RepID=UPI0036ED770C
MMTLAPQSTNEHSGQDTAMPPRADCVADSAGGLTFDVTETGEPGSATLVLRSRDGRADVNLPLTPAGDGRLRAALPSGVALPEGRWDAYARVADGEPQRLLPGVNDLRSLVDRVPTASRGHVAVRIPYATKHGNLSVRSWLRAPHAEAGELRISDGTLSVSGRVYGTGCAPGARAELRLRGADGSRTRLGADVTADRAEFGFTVDYRALRPGTWDLWLHPAGEDGPELRIARLLDDVADKKPIFTYPRTAVDLADGGRVEAGPYYTNDNDLSVAVAAAERSTPQDTQAAQTD